MKGETLPPEALSALNDFHVLVYRLFGVHASIQAPFIPADRNPWDEARPTLCDAIRRKPGMLERCDACEARLMARARTRAARGLCHAGLGQVAIPLRRRGRTIGHVLCSPARFPGPAARTVRRIQEGVGETAYPVNLREEVRELPVLDPARRAELVAFVDRFFAAFFGRMRGPFLTDPAWYHLPVRAPHDTEAWVSFLWTGFEPHSTDPLQAGWHVHRSHDVLLHAAAAAAGLVFPEQRQTVRPGEAVHIPAGQRYRLEAPPAAARPPFWVHYVSTVDLRGLGLAPFVPPPAARLALRELVHGSRAGWPYWYSTGAKLKTLELLLELRVFAKLPARRRGAVPGRAAAGRLDRVRRWLEEHPDRSASLGDLAVFAGMNRFTLARAFRREHGMAPLAYHRGIRAREGARLMRDEGLAARDAARRLGFATPQHFHRVFKRTLGLAPGAWVRAGAGDVTKG